MIPAHTLRQVKKSLEVTLGVKTSYVTRRVPTMEIGFMLAGQPPKQRYTTETVEVKTEQWAKLVGLLFCMPTSKPGKEEILPNLEYFHFRSSTFVDFFCIGYEALKGGAIADEKAQSVANLKGVPWTFNASDFNGCRAVLESETKWRFSGETDLLLAVARKSHGGEVSIDYSAAIACNLEEMIRDNAITSVRSFFEKIFQFGEKYDGNDPVWTLSDKLGIAAGGNFLQESVLSLLPETVKKQYKATKHFVIADIST